MTFLKVSILLLVLVSCKKGVTFNPDFYVPSLNHKAIINEEGVQVKFTDTRIRQYGCMSRNKIIELKMLLRNSEQLKSATVEDMTDRDLHDLILRIDTER